MWSGASSLTRAGKTAYLMTVARRWGPKPASAMRTVRRHLLGERGLDRDQLYTRGYWKIGVADHPDHDTGED